jgi:ElaB/YqjD/DUF883 family membrane-anchored ribosome-binding protein
MATEAWDNRSESKAASAAGAAQEATARGAEYATERVEELAKQGRRVARDVDPHLERSTGRSSAAWLDEGARLIKTHPWKAVTAMAVVAFMLGKLRG